LTRTELQQLARDRLADAKALLAGKRWAGADYLSGYAGECALKACIAKMMKPEVFPDKTFAEKCWTHDLERLLALAGLKDAKDADIAADADLKANWFTLKDWSESARYAQITKGKALALYEAITNAKHGVSPWIKSRW
jgi:HEPN domain-containing protein